MRLHRYAGAASIFSGLPFAELRPTRECENSINGGPRITSSTAVGSRPLS